MGNALKSLKGMNDLYFEDIVFWHEIERTARQIFENYGYGEIRTPVLEQTALFARGMGGDTQVVQKEMYTFEDKSGDSVTLRPEGTASVVRAYIEHAMSSQDEVTKLYYMGPMFRYERPQKGRMRQFHQIGAECFGTDSPLADAELIIMMDQFTKALGIQNYEVLLNSLGLLSEREKYLQELTTYFAKHKNDLDEDSQNRLNTNPLRILDSKNEKVKDICLGAPEISDFLGEESKAHFATVTTLLDKARVTYTINPFLVRGLDYYERTTFEFVSNDLGAQSAFCGGGRYNRLVEELGGKPTPAVGFALGCERLVLLIMANRTLNEHKKPGAYFVAMDEPSRAKAFELMQHLRSESVACEMGYELKSMKSQMRRANKLSYRHAVIIGENELKTGKAQVKDLEKGSQNDVAFEDLLNTLS